MEKKRFKRALAGVLALFVMITSVFVADDSLMPVQAREARGAASTKVYFYNSDNYADVIVHAWSDNNGQISNLTGNWGETKAVKSDIGDGWMEAEIPSEPTFHVIFADASDTTETRRVTVDIVNKDKVYASLNGVYSSKEAASNSIKNDDNTASKSTKVYFYNSDNYANITVHAWSDVNGQISNLTGNWGSTKAIKSDLGDGWMEVEIPSGPSFYLIFADADDTTETRRVTVEITDNVNTYASLNGKFTSKEAAEASVKGGSKDITRVWFYNIYGYENIKAHTWNENSNNIFGADPVVAREGINSNWYFIDVPAEAPFNIQFVGDNGNMQQGYVQGNAVYLAATDKFFDSKTAVEDYMNNMKTTVYFFNYDKTTNPLEAVYGYAYANSETIGENWPGYKAQKSDIGDDWYEISIPVNALLKPFNLIINDNNGNQLADIAISNYRDNYVILKGDTKVYTAQDSAEIAAGREVKTVIYLLNNNNWKNTSVYIYGRPGEAFGGWPGKQPEAAPELGDKWQKITVPAKVPFNIIYFNKDNDSERTEMLLDSEHNIYVTGSGAAYSTQFAAEAACGMVDESELAEVYFYNSRGWGDINAYVFNNISEDERPTLGASWPGTAAEKAEEIGENWWKFKVPMKAASVSKDNSYGVVFNDGVNQMPVGVIIDDNEYIYTIATEEKFKTAKEAEEAAAKDNYDDGCEEGPNADLLDYNPDYDGEGAALSYTTYEAEKASTNGTVLEKSVAYREAIQSEASGRQAVVLDETGEYVEFTLKKAANGMVLRYSIPDTADGKGQDATLSCYVNGEEAQDLQLTSRYSWVYGSFPYFNTPKDGKAHRYYDEIRVLFDEKLPAGTKIKLQKDTKDSATEYVVDFIEMENVAAPKKQPENSLSVTEYGAVANDGKDDREAFEKCIADAMEKGKEVWIPAGNFDLVEKKFFTVSGVTIRGAGMWYSNLNGEGAAFKYYGTAKFRDFAITGDAVIRNDSDDLAGIEGNGSRSTNVTIENIWIEHTKVGVWTCNSENLIIQGCRIRNTFADGINLCSATNNAVIRNNQLRNTGDDAIASWPWLANCTGNVIEHNTIQVPTLANGIAIYGGGEFVVDSNYVADTISNGAGIAVGTEFETPKGFTGKVTVKNNQLERCGSMQADEGYPIGAIWLWSSASSKHPMNSSYVVYNNVMNDCPFTGITIECGNDLTGVNIQNNTINGAKDAIHEYYPGGAGTGSGKIGNLTVSNISGEKHKDDAPDWKLDWVDEKKPEPSINESADIELSTKSDALISDVLTEKELENSYEARVDIVMKEKELSDVEKKLIESTFNNSKLCTAFDIEIYKVLDENRIQITKLGNKIKLRINIPEGDLEKLPKDAAFFMYRIHEGVVEKLVDLDDDANTITIETDEFSTYVLAYEENGSGAADGNGSGAADGNGSGAADGNGSGAADGNGSGAADGNNAGNTEVAKPSKAVKSGDLANPYVWLCVLLGAGAVIAFGTRKRANNK